MFTKTTKEEVLAELTKMSWPEALEAAAEAIAILNKQVAELTPKKP